MGLSRLQSAEVATAVADVSTRLGLTGEALQEVARTALEGGININTFAQAMEIFGVDAADATALMDKFFTIAQDTGIPIQDLTSQMKTFGPVLQNAGFSAEESAVFFGQLNEAGVDATRVFPGINAFLRKAAEEALPDYTDAIKEARKGIEDQTKALEKNLDIQKDLNEEIGQVAKGALEDHNQALIENKEDIENAEQALQIFNARMAEQSGEIKESTRLANEFKEADLKETLAGLREESIQLAASGEVLKTAIEDVTGSELVLVEQTGLAEDKFTSAAGKIRELGADLNLTSADAATLTTEIAAQEATLAMWIEKQAAGADSSIDLRAALEAQVEAIKNAKTDTEALALATEAFGAEGAQRLSIAIRNGAFELDNMVGSLQDTEGAILSNAEATRTNTEDLKLMRQEISERLAGAWASLPGPYPTHSGGHGWSPHSNRADAGRPTYSDRLYEGHEASHHSLHCCPCRSYGSSIRLEPGHEP